MEARIIFSCSFLYLSFFFFLFVPNSCPSSTSPPRAGSAHGCPDPIAPNIIPTHSDASSLSGFVHHVMCHSQKAPTKRSKQPPDDWLQGHQAAGFSTARLAAHSTSPLAHPTSLPPAAVPLPLNSIRWLRCDAAQRADTERKRTRDRERGEAGSEVKIL